MPSQPTWEAVIARWNSEDLDTVVTGGIRQGRSKTARQPPYAVFTAISGTPQRWSNKSEVRRELFQIGIFARTEEQAGALLGTVAVSIDFAPLDIPSDDGVILECRRGQDRYLQEDDELWQAIAEWVVIRRKRAIYTPG